MRARDDVTTRPVQVQIPVAVAVAVQVQVACYRPGVPARVVCSAAMPVDLVSLLGDGVELDAPAPGQARFSPDALRARVAEADALICLVTDRIDAAFLAAAPRLRVVANYGVGIDNIDLAAAARRGVAVTNTPDVLTEATADLAFALLLAAARRLGEGERLLRAGRWGGWEPGLLLGVPVAGQTLGIIGMGRIGLAVARRASGFAMSVIYAGRGRAVAAADALGARQVTLPELYQAADFVSVHYPLSAETHHLVDRAALAAMKPTAILINTARGACVDEDALAEALAAGRLAGAGLDVYDGEPAVRAALLACERVVLAPHLGSATTVARRRMAEICAGAVRAVLDGRRPDTLIGARGEEGAA